MAQQNGKLVLRVIPIPADANVHGDVFGGWLLANVDIAAAIAAAERAKGRVATVAVDSIYFPRPVLIGDVISFYTTIVRTGCTSLTVFVEAYAAKGGEPGGEIKVTEATLTLVAIDDAGCKRRLPE